MVSPTYRVTTHLEEPEVLWEMVKDSIHMFLGDSHKVSTAVEWVEWLKEHTDYPLFLYVDGELAACTYLCGFEPCNKAAIHTFVHPGYRSPSYTIPLGYLAFDTYFKQLGLNKLEGVVASYNRPARLLCERLGFKRDGVFREHLYYKGKRRDAFLYTILRREFYGK